MSYNFDDELAPMVALLPESDFKDPAAMREGMDAFIAGQNAEVDVSSLLIDDRHIPGFDRDAENAACDVVVRVYTPKNVKADTAGLLYIHGGGFAVGSLDSEHAGAANIATKLGVVVVSVGYRLAPEDPFPAGLYDCYAGLKYLHDNADSLNVDPSRIAVMGASAGGGLAAATVLLARELKGPPICFQYLGIPELDDRLNTPSMTQFTDTPLWSRPNAILSWKYYLGEAFTSGADDVPELAAPARIKDASGLPPAYISAMEFDPLRDEAIHYALKLLADGVAVELHTFPGTFHGSSLVGSAAVTRRQNAETLNVLQRALGVSTANNV